MEEIKDTEIRIISNPLQSRKSRLRTARRRWLVAAAILVAVVAVAASGLLWFTIGTPMFCKQTAAHSNSSLPMASLRHWIAAGDTLKTRGTLVCDIVCNRISLRLMRPINATPHLELGYNCLRDTADIVLMWRAADVRADNGKIVGAFVLQGTPISWGLSKRGYCAIIDGEITVGVADNSPLFEEATEREGDFFRQYPLVDNGRLVDNELKTKSIRRALCEIGGCVLVVETATPVSMHDFAQALVDVGATNAIYLVGGNVIGWCVDTDGIRHASGDWADQLYKNISFIVWK